MLYKKCRYRICLLWCKT